jgi:hypothetical protein
MNSLIEVNRFVFEYKYDDECEYEYDDVVKTNFLIKYMEDEIKFLEDEIKDNEDYIEKMKMGEDLENVFDEFEFQCKFLDITRVNQDTSLYKLLLPHNVRKLTKETRFDILNKLKTFNRTEYEKLIEYSIKEFKSGYLDEELTLKIYRVKKNIFMNLNKFHRLQKLYDNLPFSDNNTGVFQNITNKQKDILNLCMMDLDEISDEVKSFDKDDGEIPFFFSDSHSEKNLNARRILGFGFGGYDYDDFDDNTYLEYCNLFKKHFEIIQERDD